MNVTEIPQFVCCAKQIVQLRSAFSKKNAYVFFSNSVLDLEIFSYFLIPFPECVSSKGTQKETQEKPMNSCSGQHWPLKLL